MTTFTESPVEDAAVAWLAALGWQVAYGPGIAPAELRVKEAAGAITETTV